MGDMSTTLLANETGRTLGESTGSVALEGPVAAGTAEGRPTVTTRGDAAYREG